MQDFFDYVYFMQYIGFIGGYFSCELCIVFGEDIYFYCFQNGVYFFWCNCYFNQVIDVLVMYINFCGFFYFWVDVDDFRGNYFIGKFLYQQCCMFQCVYCDVGIVIFFVNFCGIGMQVVVYIGMMNLFGIKVC